MGYSWQFLEGLFDLFDRIADTRNLGDVDIAAERIVRRTAHAVGFAGDRGWRSCETETLCWVAEGNEAGEAGFGGGGEVGDGFVSDKSTLTVAMVRLANS